jgi:glycosyltransferase involved in cell wall biosynthesis
MRLGIDASNLRAGGGLTHLIELLRAAIPQSSGFESVVIWACAATLEQLPARRWLELRTEAALERSPVRRALWQRFRLGSLARDAGCDVLFVPGGTVVTSFRPVVTMSRNMLPFEADQLLRFGLSRQTFRLALLRLTQARSVRRADGVIFLTQYAQRRVSAVAGGCRGRVTIIPHGVDARFISAPRVPRALADCSVERPFRLLYVSIVDVYKNHPQVAEAVASLRLEGIPVSIQFIGPAYPPALRVLNRTLERLDPSRDFIRYSGPVPYAELHAAYADADLVVFASSCENMPNILIEGMASGVAVASSNRGPMPEVLANAGGYFDPQDPKSIARTLREMLLNPRLRESYAAQSSARARSYSWPRCAEDTFAFLAAVTKGRRATILR